MMNGGQDFSSIFFHDDKIFSRLPSRGERYNSSKQGEASFRVLYYGGAAGSVPFIWESQPGTPKHKLNDGPLPPLTPPPRYQSSPLASPSLKKKHSKFFNSIFLRASSKKVRLGSTNRFGFDYDEYESGMDSPTSTLCFGPRNGSSVRRSKSCYKPMKSVKNMVMSIIGCRVSSYYK